MSRVWMGLQIGIGWLPVWALVTMLIASAHGAPLGGAALVSLRMMAAAALLGIGVQRFTAQRPWPHPIRLDFVLIHVLAAAIFALAWFGLNSAIASAVETVSRGRMALALVIGPGIAPFLILGVWLYVMVAGVSYAAQAAQQAARSEALAARSQLAALHAQLHPHFLFNALHTVVQLIPIDPRAAVRAAEQLAAALRTTMEEKRDLVPLDAEWTFVQRYLSIERIRFGERLIVAESLDSGAMNALLPSFALQTLVENAIRHAAAPRAESTTLNVSARNERDTLIVSVSDNGAGAQLAQLASSQGSGLRRLRERLEILYGSSASLDIAAEPGLGFRVTLRVPQTRQSGTAGPVNAGD